MLIHENKFTLFQPHGRLDSYGGDALEQQISQLEPNRPALWVIDLAQIEFIDSAGLLSLMKSLDRANQNNCRLVLYNPRPSARLILEITQLDRVFQIADSYNELMAIANLKERKHFSPAEQVAA